MADWHYNEKREREADKYRDKMSDLEKKINELTNGEFFGGCALRGIETFTVKELQALVDKYPEIRQVVRDCLKVHAEFYDFYLGKNWRRDKSEKNMVALLNAFPPAFSLMAYAAKKQAAKVQPPPILFSMG